MWNASWKNTKDFKLSVCVIVTYCTYMLTRITKSVQFMRKLKFAALMLPAICIAAVPWMGCRAVAVLTLVTIAIGLSGAKYSAQFANFIDIAPNFAGTLLGIAYIFVSVPGWLSPLTAGLVTKGQVIFLD